MRLNILFGGRRRHTRTAASSKRFDALERVRATYTRADRSLALDQLIEFQLIAALYIFTSSFFDPIEVKRFG